MKKPIMNLDEAVFDDIEENGLYTSSRASIGAHIGAKNLGYNLTVLPPGKAQCPFHSHRGEEEMFFILEGEGELRFGDKRYALRKHDVIACPTGGPDVAHQIINTGDATMRYLSLSTLVDIEACEYPDSQKVPIITGRPGETGRLRPPMAAWAAPCAAEPMAFSGPRASGAMRRPCAPSCRRAPTSGPCRSGSTGATRLRRRTGVRSRRM
jgi:uncharacterized cupin superfamily protein